MITYILMTLAAWPFLAELFYKDTDKQPDWLQAIGMVALWPVAWVMTVISLIISKKITLSGRR